MSCLDNTDILRIVGGNSFQIAITVKARRVSDGSEIEDFDLSASSPVLNLIHAGEKTRKYFVTQGNQAIISFDGSEGLGYYGMEMSGSYNSEAWRFCIEKVLQLVDTNAKANIPEWSFLVDDTYFIEGTISIYGGGGGGDTVQADWAETNPTSAAFILHKPDLSVYATKTEVASGLAGKQDTIADLADIREGAAAGATAYQKPASGIPESDMSEGVQSALDKAEDAYQLPANGIPATDLDEDVQEALDKANSAVQTETDPVFSNSPAADITQADINTWNAKQSAIADLSDIRAGAAAGATAVQPDEMAQAIDVVDGEIDGINAKIPAAASSLNQLADKAYVNSSISTNSATYRGSYNLVTDLGMSIDATHTQIAGALATAIQTADNNDYAFVQVPDSASTPTVIAKIERYKHNGSGWVHEYDLNNSGFTAAQWAAINSGITSGLVGKLADLPNNSELATLLNGKQNVINDLSAIRSGASAGATAVQPADLTEALNDVEDEIAGLDESKQDTIEDLSTIRSGAAAGATAYQKPVTGIPESDMSDGVQTSLGKADSAYQKPASGIPATDMSEGVQASLAKANSAVQMETDPVFSNSPAAEISQADINTWNAKQPAIADLADIREGAAAGATAVQPDEMAQAIDEVDGDIADINAKIPTAASNLNQLADKAYVNSSIATNSATYRGSFNLITDLGMNVDATHAQIAGALATAIATADNNDYAFVQIPDSASTPTVIAKIERYKHNGSGWVYEYDLNNSGFTAAQWAAINSGITSGLVGKLSDLPNNSELATLLNGKQNVINDLSAIREGAAAGATAIQPSDLTEALNDVEEEIAGLDESKQDTIEDLSIIRSGAAAGATAYQKPVTGIPESDMSDGVQTSLGKADSAYQKPVNGIPATDMSESVQASLEKANSAVQTETDPVFSNSPAAEISQTDINNWNAKQPAIADLADIREGAAAGATAVQPDEMAQAIDVVDGDIADINAKIPSTASSLNQLADKAYVNSSIATNSATYRGSFNLITDLGMNIDATHAQIAGALATAIVTADNNDYAFVQIPDSASTPTVIAKIERYKHNGSGWVYEYDLNNSGFTSAQWAAINSGITSGLVGKLADLPNNSELATLLNGKQNVINDLSAIRSGASAGATAYQKPSSGIPASDMSSTVQQELSKANTAVQTETDPIFSASPAAGITAQNIQTWNGEPAARQAADNLLRTDLASEQNARQSADAALQTAIQDETADRIAADALKVNRADVQDINSVAEPMTSTTNPISAHAMGVMKQYVDAEVSQTIITPAEGSIVADNSTIESTEVETNVHQFSVKNGVFATEAEHNQLAQEVDNAIFTKFYFKAGVPSMLGQEYFHKGSLQGSGNGTPNTAVDCCWTTPIKYVPGTILISASAAAQQLIKGIRIQVRNDADFSTTSWSMRYTGYTWPSSGIVLPEGYQYVTFGFATSDVSAWSYSKMAGITIETANNWGIRQEYASEYFQQQVNALLAQTTGLDESVKEIDESLTGRQNYIDHRRMLQDGNVVYGVDTLITKKIYCSGTIEWHYGPVNNALKLCAFTVDGSLVANYSGHTSPGRTLALDSSVEYIIATMPRTGDSGYIKSGDTILWAKTDMGAEESIEKVADEVAVLKAKMIDDGLSEPAIEFNDPTWTWGYYVNTSLNAYTAATSWGVKPFYLKNGQTIVVKTAGTLVVVIAKPLTDGPTFEQLVSAPAGAGYSTYTYTATEDMTVIVSVRHNTTDTAPSVEVLPTGITLQSRVAKVENDTQVALSGYAYVEENIDISSLDWIRGYYCNTSGNLVASSNWARKTLALKAGKTVRVKTLGGEAGVIAKQLTSETFEVLSFAYTNMSGGFSVYEYTASEDMDVVVFVRTGSPLPCVYIYNNSVQYAEESAMYLQPVVPSQIVKNGSQGNSANAYVVTALGDKSVNETIHGIPGHKYKVVTNRPNREGYNYYYIIITNSSTHGITSNMVRNETSNPNWHTLDEPIKLASNEVGFTVQVTEATQPYTQEQATYANPIRVADFLEPYYLKVIDVTDWPSVDDITASGITTTLGADMYARNIDRLPSLYNACRYHKTSLSQKDWMGLICTDMHAWWLANNNAIKATNDFSVIDCYINCGDIMASYFVQSSANTFKSSLNNLTKPAYIVVGNHDVGNCYYVGYACTHAQAYDAYIKPMVDKGWLSSGEYTANLPYWYHDDTNYNIRLIGLYEYDDNLDFNQTYWKPIAYDSSLSDVAFGTTYSAGNKVKVPNYTAYSFEAVQSVTTPANFYTSPEKLPSYRVQRGTRVIRQTQAQWFLDTLASTPANYGVIVITHNPYSDAAISLNCRFSWPSGVAGSAYSQNAMETDFIRNAIAAFKNKSSYTEKIVMKGSASYMNTQTSGGVSYAYEVSKDFANVNEGVHLLGLLGGHSHRDLVFKDATENIYQVTPNCAIVDAQNDRNGDVRRTRFDGLSADSLTVVSMASGRIGLVKLGVNVTENGAKRNFEVIDTSVTPTP